jgi:hypothetical protein
MSASNLVVGLAILATFVALVFGVVNMMRGGSPSTSQRLMRWRVGLQAGAILLLLIVLWARGVRPDWF